MYLLQSTMYVRKSHRQPQHTLQLMCKVVFCSFDPIFMSLYEGSHWSRVPTFLLETLLIHLQKIKKLVKSVAQIRTAVSR
jgi:hypothetical protein